MAPNEVSDEKSVVAFFDVDGTLAASNLVDAYLDFALNGKSIVGKGLWLLKFAPKLPYYAIVDWFDRERFNKVFFSNYSGEPIEKLGAWARDQSEDYWTSRLYREALDQVHWHRNQGHKIVLVTGGLREVVEPLADMIDVDSIAATDAEVIGGRLTGNLKSGPLSGDNKTKAAIAEASDLGADLAGCYAYADDLSDQQFLGCVGHPVAVNPDRRLKNLARARGWPIRWWRKRANATSTH